MEIFTGIALIALGYANIITSKWHSKLDERIKYLELWVRINDQKINPEKRFFDYTEKGLKDELENNK